MSKQLENEVWNLERCAGCGACVAACSKRILYFEGDVDHPSKKVVRKTVGLSTTVLDVCHFCEMAGEVLCELSCPRMKEDWPDGPVQKEVLVRTTGQNPSGVTNEIVSNLLAGAMRAGMIDGALISDVDRWTLISHPRVAMSIADLVESAGNQFIWNPTLEGLAEAIYANNLHRIAVVGLPCMMEALERISTSNTKALDYISDRIILKVGLFCAGVYRQESLSEISSLLKIPQSSIKAISVSQRDDRLEVTTFSGETMEVNLSDVVKLVRKGCGRCYDLLAEAADISIGPLGAPEGHSVAIVRTNHGENALDNAIAWDLLEVKDGVDDKALEVLKANKKKRKKAEMIDGLQILMLEAFKDPSRIDEARKRFGEYYSMRTVDTTKEKEPADKSGCGTCSMC